ncbi:hypothetical protein WK57_30380 [Burkholderia ubonensis]|uniref:Phage head morphogenesis domain-containing protein n=1 Tax=Burkholderia ubonensis TaxID=101571 RepID=A0AA40R508_9BURK|nr:phage minor head protein [Burkholderia ubonensis]KWZ53297.1 hypothetical protein WK57_30380 [Burkholderia ubonensis]
MGNLSDLFAHLFVEHGINLIRASAGIEGAAAQKVQSLIDDLVLMLNAVDAPEAKKSVINSLIREAYATIDEHYSTLGAGLLDHLSLIAEIEGKFLEKTMNKGIGAKLIEAPKNLADGARKVLVQGATASDWLARQAADTQFKFRAAVSTGYQNGETTQQIVARIAGAAGFMELARRNVTTLVHTAVQETAADARLKLFKANDDVVRGVQVIATLDGRTCLVCMNYDGATYDLDGKPIDGTDLPYDGGAPFHFGCRCAEIPITRSWKELGIDAEEIPKPTRASMNGQVAGNLQFEDWLADKTAAFQDKVLGPGRAKLFREGKITLRDLLNQNGRPLTLDELRAKYE